jgi:hypothetical protein
MYRSVSPLGCTSTHGPRQSPGSMRVSSILALPSIEMGTASLVPAVVVESAQKSDAEIVLTDPGTPLLGTLPRWTSVASSAPD